MERILGESLEAGLDRGDKLEPEDARKLMIEAARGLRDAQGAGIVHRDVKPSNSLRAPSALKIADFGPRSRRATSGKTASRRRARCSERRSTSHRSKRKATVDFATDMYSLGCTFFHLLTGAPPYEGNGAILILASHLNAPVASVLAKAPNVPHRLAAIVERLMAKKPIERFASYDDMISALEAAAPDAVEYAGFDARRRVAREPRHRRDPRRAARMGRRRRALAPHHDRPRVLGSLRRQVFDAHSRLADERLLHGASKVDGANGAVVAAARVGRVPVRHARQSGSPADRRDDA